MILTNHAVANRADLRERTKTMSSHGDRRGEIADFRDSFERIEWLYLQLNLEPTRPGCKVPTDLVKISVKKGMHTGFYYRTSLRLEGVKIIKYVMLALWGM